ncbi:hypothetical protein CORC01_06734 [Colletotrichum orchidophilum]|uniref:Uncharacterized protein n=1 Tax=Colletotrichum orchidophilum TaxID=1209926 RepID=A0A1G4B8Y6_9PEZI|nr:uncharacterized protein CORC01_06734 [Colletotrichum orchidophilum]OHE97871.1 hypothetical protein CORC01_06734 [Colletotrichum orchidophilum]
MEAKLLDDFDGNPSTWVHSPGILPAPQDLDWLLPYSMDNNSSLYGTDFSMEDLLAPDMHSLTFMSPWFSIEESSPARSLHQYIGLPTPDPLYDTRTSYPTYTPGTEQSKLWPVSTPDVSQGGYITRASLSW